MRFRFAARTAFLMFRRAARRCFADDIIIGRRSETAATIRLSAVFVSRAYARLFLQRVTVRRRSGVVTRDGLVVKARDVMPIVAIRA